MEIENLRELLDTVLAVAAREKASDVYIKADCTPMLRIEGNVFPVECDPLQPSMTEHLALSIMPPHLREKWDAGYREANFVYQLKGAGRFRVNAYQQRGTVAMVLRLVQDKILEFEQLGLPEVLKNLCMQKRGIVLVTGPTGSGKSTTLASMIRYRKEHAPGHIVTIEDPIEYLHADTANCIVSQREVGTDTASFKDALESALRQAPDVLLVGEMRDTASVEAAVYFAETGHLVLSTLHANNAIQTVERTLQFFPEEMHKPMLAQISINLRGIISQRLVPSTDGKRVAAVEILIGNVRMQELLREGNLNQIRRELDQFHTEGMQTFETSLLELYKAGRITAETAIRFADNATDMRLKLKHTPVTITGKGDDRYAQT
ncbi:MAG TPA: PilT/PilU family type 4a pilus ATPase [Candidatus Nitrosotenuis sp.]|jgi:twitching motility protein PilU|nr:PilT/PilU family type 4a pilus ATPase [Candidatus Nitrosotenuis sp.]